MNYVEFESKLRSDSDTFVSDEDNLQFGEDVYSDRVYLLNSNKESSTVFNSLRNNVGKSVRFIKNRAKSIVPKTKMRCSPTRRIDGDHEEYLFRSTD